MYDILDHAIGSAPVSTVDLNEVVAKGRRRTVRRRLAIGGAAGGTALVAAGIVTTLAITLFAAAPGGRTAVQAGAGTLPSAPTRDSETREQTAERLAIVLTAAVVAAIPGTEVSDGGTGHAPVVVSFDDSATSNGTRIDLPRFSAEAVLSGTGSSEVFLVAQPGGSETATSGPPTGFEFIDTCEGVPYDFQFEDHSARQECAATTGPAGQVVILVSERCLDCPGQPIFRVDAYVTWANARVNVGVISVLKRGGTSQTLTTPLLTVDQLVAIATNPDLTVTA